MSDATVRDDDLSYRMAAFAAVRRLTELRGDLSSDDLKAGFLFNGERIPLVNPQRGIFRPRQMKCLLSIRTVFPRAGRRVWYDDQREVHRQIYDGEETVDYAFMGNNPDAADNRWLREAMENCTPFIYFLGVAPGLYRAVIPTFVIGWDRNSLKASIAFGMPEDNAFTPPENGPERRYALHVVQQRLHQASFREAVMAAYDGRCALSGLPEQILLDAAHIIADKDEKYGHPIVQNGIPLSKIHHAAFDAHLIGIDPDYRIHISERLLNLQDGPMLETLKNLDKRGMHLPRRIQDYPGRERLALRYEEFTAAA